MKTFTIDNKGNRWVWNCGWYIVDKDGEPLRTRVRRPEHRCVYDSQSETVLEWRVRGDIRQQPMTHAEFRKNVKILNPKLKADREVLHGMDRPNRAWRRYVHKELMSHDQFGSCYLLATDGCHAVIEIRDGSHKYVCFENLSEKIGIPLPPRAIPKTVRKTSTTRGAKHQAKVDSLVARFMQKHSA